MSLIDGIKEESGLPSIVLGILVILLLLLASVIWVAFCMAIHRTAKRMAEYKRLRRRQHIISAAIGHAISQSNSIRVPSIFNSSFPVYLTDQNESPVLRDPPSYDDAIRMKVATLNKFSRSLSQPIAPERPISSSVAQIQDQIFLQGPPSYEAAVNSTENMSSTTLTQTNSSRRQSVY